MYGASAAWYLKRGDSSPSLTLHEFSHLWMDTNEPKSEIKSFSVVMVCHKVYACA